MYRLILSCEHGGKKVPHEYSALFRSRSANKALRGHRGMDRGALELAVSLARELDAPLVFATVTRLLIDLNRSLHNPSLLSEFSRRLDRAAKSRLITNVYTPHRQRIEDAIRSAAARGDVVCHVAVHSFTPRLRGQERTADIGLLYDPGRISERSFAGRWQRAIRAQEPGLRVRRNYPYLGRTDGLTTAMRKLFAPRTYLGIELEVNQRLLDRAAGRTAAVLGQTLAAALAVEGRRERRGASVSRGGG